MINKISKDEWKFAFLFSITIIFLTLLPVFYNYITAPTGYHFMGIVTNLGDSNTYFDYMNQAADGKLTFRNNYTSEDMSPLLIRPLWWLMGLFTIFLPAIFVWHFFRSVLGIGLLLLFFYFSSRFIKEPLHRKYALAFFSLASGFGAYFLIFNKIFGTSIITADLWTTEAIPFLTLNGAPHFIASYLLLLGSVMFFIDGIEQKNKKKFLIAGILGLFLGFIHIYDLVPLFLTTGIYSLYLYYSKKINVKNFFSIILFYVISSLSGLYYAYVFLFDPVFSNWTSQNILLSPKIHILIFSLGILFFTTIFYLIIQKKKFTFLSFWFIITFCSLYLPLSFQSRFIEGLFIPMTILGILGLFTILKKITPNNSYQLIILLIVLLLSTLTNVYIFSQYFSPTYYPQSLYSAPFYLSDEEITIFNELNSYEDQVILMNPKLSNYIPRLTSNRAYVAHWAQTINFESKLNDYKQFISYKEIPEEVNIVVSYDELPYTEVFKTQHYFIYEIN